MNEAPKPGVLLTPYSGRLSLSYTKAHFSVTQSGTTSLCLLWIYTSANESRIWTRDHWHPWTKAPWTCARSCIWSIPCSPQTKQISPEEWRRKLLSWLMMGMLGKDGLLTLFFKATPKLALHGLLMLGEIEMSPLVLSGPKPVETERVEGE